MDTVPPEPATLAELTPLNLARFLTTFADVAVRLDELVEALPEVDEDALWACLSAAIDEDLVEVWERVKEVDLVTLTLHGAAVLGVDVEILRVGYDTVLRRWVERRRIGRKSPRHFPATWEELNDRADDDRPDPRAQEPWEIAAAREEEERLANGDRAPKVWILLGMRQQWPMPRQRKDATRFANGGHPSTECEVPHGTRPPHNHYCLACDTSGVDRELPRVEVARSRRHYHGSKLKGGTGAG